MKVELTNDLNIDGELPECVILKMMGQSDNKTYISAHLYNDTIEFKNQRIADLEAELKFSKQDVKELTADKHFWLDKAQTKGEKWAIDV